MEAVLLTTELREWLLSPKDPALRAKVLVDLLDYPEDDSEVIEARARIPEQSWVKGTLKAFETGKIWDYGIYQKYRGPSWVLSHLTEIGLPADHPAMQQGIQYLLDNAQPLDGFKADGKVGKRYAGCEGCYWHFPVPCITARVSRILSKAGFSKHPSAVGARKAFLHVFDPEFAFDCTAMELSLLPGCFMTVPEVMKAVLTVPKEERTTAEKKFLREAAELLKRHHLYKYVPVESNRWREETLQKTAGWVRQEKEKWLAKGLTEPRKEKPGWLKFSFPHSYNPDLLEVLLVLGEFDSKRDAVIDEGIELVLAGREKNGCWKMSGGLNGKMWADLDEKNKPSPWITYRALKMLKQYELLTE